MIPKSKNKRMGEIALLVVLIASIVGAIGTYIYNKTSSKTNRERHAAVIEQGKDIKEKIEETKTETKSGVEEIKKEINKNERLFVTPSEIIIPAKASRDVPIIVTNNKPFPVFMAVLEFQVESGEIDLGNDFIVLPMETGIHKPKYMSYQVSQINAGASVNLLVKINGNKYKTPSTVKIALPNYMKDPIPDFSMDSVNKLPKTIKVPENFVPKVYKNE